MKKYSGYIIGLLSLIIIVSISIIIYKKFENDTKRKTDAEKFKSEYKNVSKENIFEYISSNEIIKILENGTGVIYIGFPECPWCQAYVPILNEVAIESGIEKIYYLNILNDRKNNTKEYQKIVELLNENLLYNDEGNKYIFVPDITIVNKGKIIGHNNESSIITENNKTPETYWTEEKIENLKITLKEHFDKIK